MATITSRFDFQHGFLLGLMFLFHIVAIAIKCTVVELGARVRQSDRQTNKRTDRSIA